MTRDSKILPILQISALVLAAMVAMMTNPGDYGLSPIVVKWLALLSTIVGTVAGFLSTSPLRGETDPNKVSPPKLPVILLIAALGAGAIGLFGCAGKTAPQIVASAPSVVQSADAKAKALADHALGILDAAGKVLDEVITVEKKVETLMSPKMKADTRAAMNAVNDQIESAAKLIKAGVRDEAALKRAIDPLIASATSLSALVSTLPAPSQSRFGFGSLVQMLLSIVTKGAA